MKSSSAFPTWSRVDVSSTLFSLISEVMGSTSYAFPDDGAASRGGVQAEVLAALSVWVAFAGTLSVQRDLLPSENRSSMSFIASIVRSTSPGSWAIMEGAKSSA